MMTKTYNGIRRGGWCSVYVTSGGACSLLPLRLDLRAHSPDGFEWGYHGSGPAQLGLALLADALAGEEDGEEIATAYYQAFKREVVARLTSDHWEMTSGDVLEVLHRIRRAGGGVPGVMPCPSPLSGG